MFNITVDYYWLDEEFVYCKHSPGFKYRFVQNLSNIFKTLIKHNCEITALTLSEFMWQKNMFSPLAVNHSKMRGDGKF